MKTGATVIFAAAGFLIAVNLAAGPGAAAGALVGTGTTPIPGCSGSAIPLSGTQSATNPARWTFNYGTGCATITPTFAGDFTVNGGGCIKNAVPTNNDLLCIGGAVNPALGETVTLQYCPGGTGCVDGTATIFGGSA